MSPVHIKVIPRTRCAIMSETVVPCFSASARSCAASSRKEALLAAAEAIGFIHEDDVLDENGKPTGATTLSWNGDGGLEGYLEWAAVHHPGHFIPQLGRVMPLQVNVKADVPKRVVYPSLDDTRAALRARGIDPDVIERAMMPNFITDQRPVIDGEVVEDDAKSN